MIEISFDRKDVNVGKLPQPFRIPAAVLLRSARQISIIGNVWDLAAVVTERATKTAEIIDKFIVERHITPTSMCWKIQAPNESLEREFLKQYYGKFLNVSPQHVFRLGFEKIKKALFKNKSFENVVQNLPPTTLGGMIYMFGINWDVKWGEQQHA